MNNENHSNLTRRSTLSNQQSNVMKSKKSQDEAPCTLLSRIKYGSFKYYASKMDLMCEVRYLKIKLN